YGGPHTYPLVGLAQKLNSYWQLGLVMPAPYLRWHGSPPWSARFQLRPTGSRWRVLDADTGLEFYTVAREMRLSADVRWQFARSWQFEASLGVGFNRSLSTVATNGRRVAAGLDDAAFGAIAFHYSGRTANKK
ncbi:MAG: hypothetical protein OEQ74_10800, partial [Gammaproteobacteria bacterium]|nr:hypothetical protein [Gammaproteobacteria bacterium]